MRMWLCDPKIQCIKHLMGSHVEIHMFVGSLKKHKKMDGYIKNNLLQPRMLFQYHEDLVKEILRRGYKHNSPLTDSEIDIFYLPLEYQYWEIDKQKSLNDLLSRCDKCKERYNTWI